jgi:hypothetical protein
MKHSVNRILFLFFIAIVPNVFAQIQAYQFKREIKGISDPWHKLTLPNGVLNKMNDRLSDMRIYGITESQDTIEAPYLLRTLNDKNSTENIPFTLLNTAQNEKGYFFTFEISAEDPINQIQLNFKQENFVWKVKLEGSQDQREWFTILENERIVSIHNDEVQLNYSILNFKRAKYRYYRIQLNSKEKPTLLNAVIQRRKVIHGVFNSFPVKKLEKYEQKQAKSSAVDIELESPARISKIRINVSDTFDYYRPITIKYLADSFQTEKGWQYSYRTLTSGILNSMGENEFNFKSTTVQSLKIIVENHNNQPLNISEVNVSGYANEIVARFTKKANYFLAYGNEEATKPQYDIAVFSDKIPTSMRAISLLKEQGIVQKEVQQAKPLFSDQKWLWVIMIVIILLLGGFTLNMMKKNSSAS